MIETPLRLRHDISDGWEFIRGRVRRGWLSGRGKAGQQVDLPHCWNRGDTFQYGRKSYSGRGVYRRSLILPDSPGGRGSWHLRSEGFYGWGDVWLDGRAIARIDGQYLGFDINLPAGFDPGDRVASAVGRLSVRIFGMSKKEGIALAYHLGRALQLTNTLRDIDEDAGIGRLYMPREYLEQAGIAGDDPQAVAANPALGTACSKVAALAAEHFDKADAIMARSPRAAVRAPRIMAEAYRRILRRLIARGWTPPRAPVKLGKSQIAQILIRSFVS